EAAWLDAPDALVGREDPVLREPEVVRLVLVQDLVHLRVRRLADVLPAIWTAALLIELVDVGVVVADEVVARLRGGRNVARVPDAERVRVRPELPADDDGLDLVAAARELRDERREVLDLGVDLHADLLVLLGGDLKERFTRLVPLVRHDGPPQGLAILRVEAVGALRVAGVLDELLSFGRVVVEGVEAR